MTGVVNGVERWASPNGSTLEYRAPRGTLRFHGWKRSTFFGYWSMGGEISTSGTDFEAAVIDSHYYMSVSAPAPPAGRDGAGSPSGQRRGVVRRP